MNYIDYSLILIIMIMMPSYIIATTPLGTDISVKGDFILNEGSPLQTTVTIQIINASIVNAPYDDDQSPVVISNKQSNIALYWKLDQSTLIGSGISYTIITSVGDPNILEIPTLNINNTGILLNNINSITYQPLTVNFQCKNEGSSTVSIIFIMKDTNTQQQKQITIFFKKKCLPPNCDGLCIKGTCSSSVCTCDTDYGWAPFCDFGFWIDKTSICPGELFTLSWAYLSNTTTTSGNNGNDLIDIRYPRSSQPFSAWTVDAMNQAVLVDGSAKLYASSKIKDLYDTFKKVGNFSYQIFEEATPGTYGIGLWPSDSDVAIAAVTLSVKSKSDPTCLPSPIDCSCNGRGFCSAQWNCVCNDGFFGPKCEYGCAPSTSLTEFGTTFSSSIDKSSNFLNNANCSWLIQPSFVLTNGIKITINNLLTETGFDIVRIYSGSNAIANKLIATISGQSNDQSFNIPETTALVTFTSDGSYPSWPSKNKGFNASYIALGCPKGSRIEYISNTQQWQCSQCPIGTFTSTTNAEECTSCTPGTFANSIGSTLCTTCATGKHTNGNNGSSICSDCTPGKYAIDVGTPSCLSCPKGTSTSNTGTIECNNCDIGYYMNNEGATSCFSCPLNSQAPYQRAESIVECSCKEDYFTFSNATGVACTKCPIGGQCDGKLIAPKASYGYWFDGNQPTRMWECFYKEACIGGTSNSCLLGHTGKMCSKCIDGYTKNAKGLCIECSGSASSRVPIFISLFILLAWALLMIFSRRKIEDSIVKSTTRDNIIRRYQLPGLATSIGISLTYVQIMGTFGRYTTNWPPSLGSTWAAFNIMNLDTSALFVQCSVPISYDSLYMLRIYLPFALALVYIGFWLLQFIHGIIITITGPILKRSFRNFFIRVEEHQNWCVRMARIRYLHIPILGEDLLKNKQSKSIKNINNNNNDENNSLPSPNDNIELTAYNRAAVYRGKRPMSISIDRLSKNSPSASPRLQILSGKHHRMESSSGKNSPIMSTTPTSIVMEGPRITTPTSTNAIMDPPSLHTPTHNEQTQPIPDDKRFSFNNIDENNDNNNNNEQVKERRRSLAFEGDDDELSAQQLQERALRKDPEPEISMIKKYIFLLFVEPIEVKFESCVVAFIFFINIFYIYLVSSAVELFDCYEQADGTYTLTAHPDIDCFSSRWSKLLNHAIFAMIFYGVGCPLWITFVLNKYKKQRDIWMKIWTFWHNFSYEVPFRSQVYWWALPLMLRKLLISVAVVSITKDEGGKLVTAFLVIFLFLYLQVRRKPYKLVVHNLLEMRLSWICLLILFGALIFTNEVLQDGLLYQIMTAMCFISMLTAIILITMEAFMFAYPRWRQFRKQHSRGQSCLDSIREALQAV